MRSLAVLGLALTALMQAIFALTAGDRPFPYLEIQILAVLASAAAAVGFAQSGPSGRAWVAAGMGVNALMRFAQIAMGLSRLPLTLNLLLLAGYILATYAAIRWPGHAANAGPTLRASLWILAIAYFFSMLFASSRLTAAVALALGAAGMFLAAPNVGHERASQPAAQPAS